MVEQGNLFIRFCEREAGENPALCRNCKQRLPLIVRSLSRSCSQSLLEL